MKRYFFYVLFFPPALMNLLLIQMQPGSLLRYVLAGYMIAAFPAVAIALTDELFARASAVRRAAWCGAVGLVLSPAALWVFAGGGLWKGLQAACCGGVVAFLCAVVFARINQRAAHSSEPAAMPVAAAVEAVQAG